MMTLYGVARAAVEGVRGVAAAARNLSENGWPAFRGLGYGMRRWATTYDGIGIIPKYSVRSALLRGTRYPNYATYHVTESVARFHYEAEAEIARGVHDTMGDVQRWRAAPPKQAPMWYGRAVERVIDAKMLSSGDPILAQDVIYRQAFGRNAKGNIIFPDYRLDLGNQSVIDPTTPGKATKALQYPAGNVIETYSGTRHIPRGPVQPLPLPVFTENPDDAAGQ
jgi:hypothetical protein